MTPKQQRFVQEYLIDLNATQAAIRAGYKQKAAYATGAENLKKPEIQEAIQKARSKREERTELNQDWVLAHLRSEAELTAEGSSHSARIRALELLGKHLGMFEDTLKIKTELPDISKLTPEQRASLLATLRSLFAPPGMDRLGT
jgi:phage terminase small subunit